jgi:hypothetical protein
VLCTLHPASSAIRKRPHIPFSTALTQNSLSNSPKPSTSSPQHSSRSLSASSSSAFSPSDGKHSSSTSVNPNVRTACETQTDFVYPFSDHPRHKRNIRPLIRLRNPLPMRKSHTTRRLPLKTLLPTLSTLSLPADHGVSIRRHQYSRGLDVRLDTD